MRSGQTGPLAGRGDVPSLRAAGTLAILLSVAALLTCFALVAVHQRGMAIDDAFIVFRYAHWFGQGLGFRWNATGTSCEGFSSTLHVVVLGLLTRAGWDPVVAALTLNILSGIGIVSLLVLSAGPRRWYFPITAIPAVWLLTDPALVTHASRGLETLPFALLMLFVVILTGRAVGTAEPGRRRAFQLLAAACFLLVLGRPEAPLVCGACWMVAAVQLRWRRETPRSLVPGLLAFVAALAALAVWKVWYFGSLLPLPYYVKADLPGWQGVAETLGFLRSHGLLLGLTVVSSVAAWVALMRREARETSTEVLVAVLVIGPWFVYSAKILHETGFAHRFVYPIVPLAAFATIGGLRLLLEGARASRLATRTPVRVLVWVPFVLLGTSRWPAMKTALSSLEAPGPKDPFITAFTHFGKAISDVGLGERITLVCGFAGAAPYFAGARHVDPMGLASDELSRRHGLAELSARRRALQYDVASWPFPAASAGARRLEDEPKSRDEYLRRWVLPQISRYLPAEPGGRVADVVYTQMLALRDTTTLIGELDLPQPGWRSFVYVSRSSPYHDRLVEALSRRIDLPPRPPGESRVDAPQ